MLLAMLGVVIVLGALIFVHELGHFLVAKAVGVQVLRFSVGFGRPVVAWKRGETEYWISWIPLGGYVKMAGMEEERVVGQLEGGAAETPLDPARAFDNKPLWARLAVIVAGVTMNLLFAAAIYAGLMAALGEPRLMNVPVDSVHAGRLPPGAAALATLRHGDRITHIDGDSIATWNALQAKLLEDGDAGSREPGAEDSVLVRIAGRDAPLVVRFRSDAERRDAVRALRPLLPAKIGIVNPGQPAAHAGLRGGDVVVRADGDTIRSWDEMVRTIRRSPGEPLALAVLRDDSLITVEVVPETQTEDSAGRQLTFGIIGATPDPRLPLVRTPVGIGTAIAGGVEQTLFQVAAIAGVVKRLIVGETSTSEVGGPILIAQMSGQMLRLGLEQFLNFMAFFSVSLAVLNMLPIPVLDGGHVLFLLIEAVRRKPLSTQVRIRLTQIGMLVVLAIMILALSNDVIRAFR